MSFEQHTVIIKMFFYSQFLAYFLLICTFLCVLVLFCLIQVDGFSVSEVAKCMLIS